MTGIPRPLLIVTPTYDRPHRIALLERCIATFRRIASLYWIVVEDAGEPDETVARLLAQSGVRHTYLAVGPTRAWGNAQRDLALRHIRDQKLEGVVYLADDDNYYEEALFAELAQVQRAGIVPVGLLGPFGIERPILSAGRIVGWSAHWTSRRFPVDMAAFAFDAALLQDLEGPIWTYATRGGETEFLEKLIESPDDFEILCDAARKCLVWHDLPLGQTPFRALLQYRWDRCSGYLKGRIVRPFRKARHAMAGGPE